MVEDGRAIEAGVARIAAIVRQRLSNGESIDLLLRAVRPPSPHPDARARDGGPPGALWRRLATPLLGLAHLPWRRAPERTIAQITDALSLPTPLGVRVATTNVFGRYELIHAVFGKHEAEYDLLLAADPDGPDQSPVVFNWTGGPIVDLLTKSRGDLAAWPEEYLRLYCALTGSDADRFAIVDADDADGLRADSLPVDDEDARHALRETLRLRASPPRLWAVSANGALQYSAPIFFQQSLFISELELSHNGRVEMTGDEVLWTQEPR